MLERIVENWLTRSGERGFEVPFSQLLSVEGYRVLHGPVHHPFEHGKDIVAYAPTGELCAFQLKGGDMDLATFERIQPQLLALAATAVTYPGVEPPRRPDKVALVTSGSLTPPARDRLAAFNAAHRPLGLPVLETVEKEQLVARFMDAHGKYWPSQPEDLNALLKLYVHDGTGLFPTADFSGFIKSIIPPMDSARNSAISRSIASALLLTAYSTGSWQRASNHLGVAQGWITLCAGILHVAARLDLDETIWLDSYQLGLSQIRGELEQLSEEACQADDLLIPDLVEGAVYATRSVLVCGYLAAFYLSEQVLGEQARIMDCTRSVLLRELPFMRVPGEVAAPYFICIGSALESLAEHEKARQMVFEFARTLATQNQLGSKNALPDPYHDFDDVLKRTFGADVDSPDERFDSHAYTLAPAINWLARRGERNAIAALWPDVTRLTLHEFQVSSPAFLLSPEDEEGQLLMWHPAMPESWGRLSAEASSMKESELPPVLWRHLEFLPYLLLTYPHRFVRSTEKALEYAGTSAIAINLDLWQDE